MGLLGFLMTENFGNVREILERILSSYGVKSQVEYAEVTNIPVGTVQNWLKRGKLPGDYILQCSLETGADVNWLVYGESANASLVERRVSQLTGQQILEAMKASGGKAIMRRIMDAYGFTLQKQLGDHLNLPSGTMSAWIRRDHFPGDIVIVCALDTGVSLYWLATGNGSMHEKHNGEEQSFNLPSGLKEIAKYSIHTGKFSEDGKFFCDESLLDLTITNPVLVDKNGSRWLVELDAKNITNGRWLVDVDGTCDVYELARLPGNKLSVRSNASQFECLVDEVVCLGKVFLTLSKSD